MARLRTTIAAATLAAALPAHALAQRPASRDTLADSVARRLPPIEVLGSLLPLGAPAVAADPTRVAIVDAATLRARRPRLLADALQSQPGLSTYDDLGSAYKPTIVTRGFAASPVVGLPQGVSVFLDGVPVNEPDAGQVNFDLLPLRHVRQVEVLAGTASLLGPNSLGGAVNLVTRRGGGAPAGEIELAGGSNGRRSAELSTGGETAGWQWYAGGAHDREDGWRQLTSARLTNAVVNVGRWGETRGAGLQALAARSRAETAGSLPLSVYGARPDSNLTAGDFEDLEQLHLAASAYAPLGTFEATRFAIGCKNQNAFAIHGAGGLLRFDLERLNHLEFVDATVPSTEQGPRDLLVTDLKHPVFGNFWRPGHIIGYEHTFIATLAEFLDCLARDSGFHPSFADALVTQRALDALLQSSRTRQWTAVGAS